MQFRAKYGAEFIPRVCKRIAAQLDTATPPPIAPLGHAVTALEISHAMHELLGIARAVFGARFECPLDTKRQVPNWTPELVADFLITIALAAHRASGDPHATLAFELLAREDCFRSNVLVITQSFRSAFDGAPLIALLCALQTTIEQAVTASGDHTHTDGHADRVERFGDRASDVVERQVRIKSVREELIVGSRRQAELFMQYVGNQPAITLSRVESIVTLVNTWMKQHVESPTDDAFEEFLADLRLRMPDISSSDTTNDDGDGAEDA